MDIEEAKDIILSEKFFLKSQLAEDAPLIMVVDIEEFPLELRADVLFFLDRLNFLELNTQRVQH